VPIFAWVAIDIVLWGFISRYLNSVTSSGLNFVPTLLGAVLLFDFFTRVMHGVTGVFLEEVWSRNFLNLFASPITIPQYLLGLVITTTVTSLIGIVVMLLLATAVFGLSFYTYGLMLVPFLLILFLFGVALGVCTSAMVLRLGPSAEWFVWPVPAIVSPFAGVFCPMSTLPAWMQFAGKLLPLSYVFEGLRTIVAGGTVPGTSLLWGLGLKQRILAERQLTATIGIAANKLLAKFASDHQKPDGLTLFTEMEKVQFLRSLPVRALYGVGKVTEQVLRQAGCATAI
jgi:ABC-2 type transport system permease protein